MQLKSSMVVLTALCVASVSSRPFKHGRRACSTTVSSTSAAETSSAPSETTAPTTTSVSAPAESTTAPVSSSSTTVVESSSTETSSVPVTTESSAPVTTQAPTTSASSTSAPPATTAAAATCTNYDGDFCIDGFGSRTASSGSGETYVGNVGSPWGSNIIAIDASVADLYKYTVHFVGSSNMAGNYQVVIWNKIGPDGKMDGWYGNSAVSFSLAPGGEQYVAFDEDSQGGWGAALGTSLPTDQWGGYDSTWGEFDFGSTINTGWSGFDVSEIQAQAASAPIQGMQICDVTSGSPGTCSTITTNGATVDNAYTQAEASEGGIGGNLSPGKVRLQATIEYNG